MKDSNGRNQFESDKKKIKKKYETAKGGGAEEERSE